MEGGGQEDGEEGEGVGERKRSGIGRRIYGGQIHDK